MPMATKFGMMVTCLYGLNPINPLDPFIMWHCKVTRQPKTIMSPLLECLWPQNLAGW